MYLTSVITLKFNITNVINLYVLKLGMIFPLHKYQFATEVTTACVRIYFVRYFYLQLIQRFTIFRDFQTRSCSWFASLYLENKDPESETPGDH